MQRINSRFGEIEYDQASTLLFPQGVIGFESLRNFVVMPNKKEGPLFWIQSVDDPQVAFVLTDPTGFFLDYKVVPDARERDQLAVSEQDEVHALVVVTVRQDKRVTLNLAAPLLFSPKSNRALQVILEGTNFSTQTPLPEVSGK